MSDIFDEVNELCDKNHDEIKAQAIRTIKLKPVKCSVEQLAIHASQLHRNTQKIIGNEMKIRNAQIRYDKLMSQSSLIKHYNKYGIRLKDTTRFETELQELYAIREIILSNIGGTPCENCECCNDKRTRDLWDKTFGPPTQVELNDILKDLSNARPT